MRVLVDHYGIDAESVTRIERGHMNESFLVTSARGSFVLRRAWSGKPADQIAREEHVLSTLDVPWVPRIVAAHTGDLHVVHEGRVHHLFEVLPGEPGPTYLEPTDLERTRAVMVRLRTLHAALPGWVHGDVHLGNVLWRGLEVSGLVDFDDTRPGDHTWEVAMTLFALARRPDEDAFRYDRDLWLAGLAAYGDLRITPEHHERAFCEYQVEIHETAASRGLWALTDGIGYWPCKRTLTAS